MESNILHVDMDWVPLFGWDIISVLPQIDNTSEYGDIPLGIIGLHPSEELARNDWFYECK